MFSNYNLDAPVVVGPVSLNKKKAKRNLQRIAANNKELLPKEEVTRFDNLKLTAPILKQETARSQIHVPAPRELTRFEPQEIVRAPAPKPMAEKVEMSKRWADFSDDEDDDFLVAKPINFAVPVAVAAAPAPVEVVEIPQNEVEAAEEPKKRKVHRGGRSAGKREEQRQRMLSKIAPQGCFSNIPDAVLAQIFDCVELRAIGAVCATGRAASAAIWANGGFWAYVSNSGAPCRESFRRWLYGLEGDWSVAFSAYAATANGTEALREAEYLAGGLLVTERRVAPQFVDAIVCATHRVTEKWDEAEAIFGALVIKATRRTEVFGVEGCKALEEAGELMRERALLARLAEDDGWDDFDHFLEPPEPEVQEAEKEDEEEEFDLFQDAEEEVAPVTRVLDLDFAQTFLDLL
jgi:hypothetical protein